LTPVDINSGLAWEAGGGTIGTLVFGLRPVEPRMTGALAAIIFSIPALRGIMLGAPFSASMPMH
jgi:chorismate synthase